MLTYFKFSTDQKKCVVHLDDEMPFLRLVKYRFLPDDIELISTIATDIQLKVVKRVKSVTPKNHQAFTMYINSFSTRIDPMQKQTLTQLNEVINKHDEYEFASVEFEIENLPHEHISLEIWYETEEIIPFGKEHESFEEHLSDNGNTKILFSGAFGTGKTTYLKEFFEGKDDYEVFHLFPVNYSVASNEDIFQYIKVEILFLLIEKGIEFDKETFSRLQTLPYFMGNHAKEMLLIFARLLPKVGKSAHSILDSLLKLVASFKENNEVLQIDDEQAAIKFMEEVYEKEGSIFEDNFYTQLIRQLLEEINDSGKKTVLIIDDLDRIDPDHVFRLLNVFAAQVDRTGFRDEFKNKFGFNKVILVCHYENIKKIYQHKFGASTDFSGYIDKYFSRSRFEFSVKEVYFNLLKSKTSENKKERSDLSFYYTIIYAMINDSQLRMRELKKLLQTEPKLTEESAYQIGFKIINHLCKIIDIESIKERFSKMKESLIQEDNSGFWSNYEYIFIVLLSGLLFYDKNLHSRNKTAYYYEYKKLSFYLETEFSPFKPFGLDGKIIFEKDDQTISFNRSDCFAILEKLAFKYQQLNGL